MYGQHKCSSSLACSCLSDTASSFMPESKFVQAEETTTTLIENTGDAHVKIRYACCNYPESALSETKKSALSETKIGMGLDV